MKKYYYSKNVLLLSALLAVGALTSCVYDKDVETPEPSGEGTLVININSTPVGTRATTLEAGDALLTQEKAISSMVIGIFRADDGTRVEVLGSDADFTLAAAANAAAGYTQNAQLKRTAEQLTTDGKLQVADGDSVLIAVNVTDDVITKLKAATVTSPDAFRAVTSTIDQALSFANSGATASDPAKLPMFGKGKIVKDGALYKVSVNVRHTVVKVTLNSIKLEVSGANTFTPQKAFLMSVPESVSMKLADDGSFQFPDDVTTYYQGYNNEGTNADTYRAFLTTGDFGASALSNGQSYTGKNVLYALPNKPATANTNATKLVIQGKYDSDVVYYAIDLLNVRENKILKDESNNTIYGLWPNQNYVLDVVIKRPGTATPDAKLGVNQNAEVSFSVSDWDAVTPKTTTFGGEGGSPVEE